MVFRDADIKNADEMLWLVSVLQLDIIFTMKVTGYEHLLYGLLVYIYEWNVRLVTTFMFIQRRLFEEI